MKNAIPVVAMEVAKDMRLTCDMLELTDKQLDSTGMATLIWSKLARWRHEHPQARSTSSSSMMAGSGGDGGGGGGSGDAGNTLATTGTEVPKVCLNSRSVETTRAPATAARATPSRT
mmetsp:Transcript_20184/g.43369  ORF Transcript_20184/g.43369 Transcript_20184/m.43369 type:complete len:117 (-) Transcript_20184:346-696(-)